MELKTQVTAEKDRQEIFITRDFNIPVDALFTAFTDPKIVAQWMNTHVEKLECQPHGSYRFVTTDPMGNEHGFNGVIHEIIPQQRITRTFQMESASFPVQLEYLDFKPVDTHKSLLTMHVIYQSVTVRDAILKLPFVKGINMAHNRLEQLLTSSQPAL